MTAFSRRSAKNFARNKFPFASDQKSILLTGWENSIESPIRISQAEFLAKVSPQNNFVVGRGGLYERWIALPSHSDFFKLPKIDHLLV